MQDRQLKLLIAPLNGAVLVNLAEIILDDSASGLTVFDADDDILRNVN